MKRANTFSLVMVALAIAGCASTSDRPHNNMRCVGHITKTEGKVVRNIEDCYWDERTIPPQPLGSSSVPPPSYVAPVMADVAIYSQQPYVVMPTMTYVPTYVPPRPVVIYRARGPYQLQVRPARRR